MYNTLTVHSMEALAFAILHHVFCEGGAEDERDGSLPPLFGLR